MRAMQSRCPWALLLLAFALTGCGLGFQHPLSDERSSVVDEDLLGGWLTVPEEGKEAEERGEILVGRKAGTKNTLEMVFLEIGEDGTIAEKRFDLLTTRIGDRRYLSTSLWQGAEAVNGPWVICGYSLAKDRLAIHLPEPDAFAEAVQEKQLAGTIENNDEGPAPSETQALAAVARKVHVTSATDALRTWVTANAETAFDWAEKGLELERTRRPKAQATDDE